MSAGSRRISPDDVDLAVGLVEDARPHVERLGADLERPGDLLEDLRRRPSQPALDLGEVGVGHPRHLGELAQGQLSDVALLTDELAEVVPTAVQVVAHPPTRYRDSREHHLHGSEHAQARPRGLSAAGRRRSRRCGSDRPARPAPGRCCGAARCVRRTARAPGRRAQPAAVSRSLVGELGESGQRRRRERLVGVGEQVVGPRRGLQVGHRSGQARDHGCARRARRAGAASRSSAAAVTTTLELDRDRVEAALHDAAGVGQPVLDVLVVVPDRPQLRERAAGQVGRRGGGDQLVEVDVHVSRPVCGARGSGGAGDRAPEGTGYRAVRSCPLPSADQAPDVKPRSRPRRPAAVSRSSPRRRRRTPDRRRRTRRGVAAPGTQVVGRRAGSTTSTHCPTEQVAATSSPAIHHCGRSSGGTWMVDIVKVTASAPSTPPTGPSQRPVASAPSRKFPASNRLTVSTRNSAAHRSIWSASTIDDAPPGRAGPRRSPRWLPSRDHGRRA